MKRFLVLLFLIFPCFAFAVTIDWYVDDQLYQTTTCTAGDNVTPPTAPTKYGYTFHEWRTYTPIEYIQSTGLQYINTWFKPNQNTRVIMEYMVSSDFSAFLFGARNAASGNNQLSYGTLYSGDNTFSSDYNARLAITRLTSSFYNQKLTCDKNKQQIKVYNQNGNILAAGDNATAALAPNYALIFPNTQSGPTITYIAGSIKIYSFKLYDNDTLIHDFVPALDFNGTPCMYDTVTETFFYNAGTGDFIAGPEIGD